MQRIHLREYPEIDIDTRYCAPAPFHTDNCVNNMGGNFTFYIPVSRHMTSQMLHLELWSVSHMALSYTLLNVQSTCARKVLLCV